METVPGSTVRFTMRPVWVVQGGFGRPLWFAETETTWDAYDVFYQRLDETNGDVAGAGREGPDAITRPTLPYAPPDHGWGHSGYPAIGVTSHAATKYCEWLSAKTGRRYRLPTASEFHEARQGRLPESFSDVTGGDKFWHAGNSGETTHAVASIGEPTRDGLHDLLGNVAEWCVDDYGTPVVCGGSFMEDANQILLSFEPRKQTRDWNASDPSFPKSKWWLRDAPFVGFRVVCEEGPG